MGISVQERIMDERETVAGDGEPIETVTRAVHETGDSVYHTTPYLARRLLGLDKGDEVTIDIYDDGYVVRTVTDDEC